MSTWTCKAHNLRATQAAILAEILLEEIDPDEPLHAQKFYGTNGGDHVKLRGIPAIGRNVAGAIAGTSPHQRNWSVRAAPYD